SIPEEQTLTILLSSLTVSDIDNPQTDLSVEIQADDHYSVVTANSLLPEENYNGILSVNLVVNDLESLSAVFAAEVTVTPVNDAPVIDPIPDQEITEGSLFTDINLDDFVEDVETSDALITWTYSDDTYLQVTIVDRVANITVPHQDWTGSDTIIFIATDDDATTPLSDSDTVIFTVSIVNDPPVISGQQAISSPEDQILKILLSSLNVSDVDNPLTDLLVEIQAGVHYTMLGADSLVTEENYNGTLSVNLVVRDLVSSSDVFAAEATITPVNDAPVIDSIPDQ
ncbi:unnamed protein product, partial [marine sediment metagenome]